MPRDAKPPACLFYWKDWIASTRELGALGRGVYIDMLALCWENGSVPDDATAVSTAVGAAVDQVLALWPLLRRKFEADPTESGRLINLRLEEERSKQSTFRELQAAKGRASGAARANRGSTAAQPSLEPKSNIAFASAFASKEDLPERGALGAGDGGDGDAAAPDAPGNEGDVTTPATPARRAARVRRTTPKPESPPLPFRAADALAEVAKHAPGRFAAPATISTGHAIQVEKAIRSYPRIEQWRELGRWLEQGNDGRRGIVLVKTIAADALGWFAHVEPWCKAGRKPAVQQLPFRNGNDTTAALAPGARETFVPPKPPTGEIPAEARAQLDRMRGGPPT